MNKVFKWAVLAVLAIALLIKLSLWLSVRSIMDTAIQQMSPVMDISYGGITSSFSGRVGLENVRIRVPLMRDSFEVDHAELRFKSLGELLRFKERLDQGKFPDQLTASLKGLKLEVHGPFMSQLYAAPAERSVFTAMSEVSCGSVRNIGTVELLEMGYRTIDSDVDFSYFFMPGAQTLTFNLHADTRDMIDLRSVFTVMNMPDNPGDFRVNPPRVSNIMVELSDNQYQRKVQEFCASKLGKTTAEYQVTAAKQFDGVLRAQGIALNQSLLDGYGRYLADPQSLRLEFSPTESVAWDGLQFFDAKDVLTMLRPVVLVNQQALDVDFDWVKVKRGTEQTAMERISAETPEELAKKQTRDQFVSVATLPEHAGKRLRFITYEGTYYQGILHKVENGRAYLSVQMGSGTAEMFLRLDKIAKVRVML